MFYIRKKTSYLKFEDLKIAGFSERHCPQIYVYTIACLRLPLKQNSNT